jgi:hypothetical protein
MVVKNILVCFALTLFSLAGSAQGSKMQSLFIYNFTKNINWPNIDNTRNFKIGIFGNDEYFKDIQALLNGKVDGNRKIEVVYVESSKTAPQLDVIYIMRNKSDEIYNFVSKSRNTLIITDKPGMIEKGAGINFLVVEGKQTFEISKANIEKSGLMIGASLLSLGIIK